MKTCKVCGKDHVMVVMERSNLVGNKSQEIRYCILCGALYVGVHPANLNIFGDTTQLHVFMEDGLAYVIYRNSAGAKFFGSEDKK